MQTEPLKCQVSTCECSQDSRFPFCHAHWKLLPQELQMQLLVERTISRCLGQQTSPSYKTILARAVKYVEAQLGIKKMPTVEELRELLIECVKAVQKESGVSEEHVNGGTVTTRHLEEWSQQKTYELWSRVAFILEVNITWKEIITITRHWDGHRTRTIHEQAQKLWEILPNLL